jgi:RimJ/RimL family protein N-acetyltransferase
MMPLTPVTLQGRTIELVPMGPSHHASLCSIGLDERLWQRTTIQVRTAEEMREYLQVALDAQPAGTALPFVIQKRDSGQIIGSTRFHSYNALHRRIEIGFTWLAVPWQGTGANLEAKLLMLRHAFESLDCVRVQFTADMDNAPSRHALERLGATYEGILRSYMISDRAGPRDVAIYSIVASEWADLAMQLKARVGL